MYPSTSFLSDVRTLGGLAGLANYSNVVTSLNLTSGSDSNDPMWLGDMYASLTFGKTGEAQRIAVLLNRPGVDISNGFGSSLSALNVTLDDSSSGNVWDATSSSGTYKADGRLGVNPYGAGVAFANGANGLAALTGDPLASNRVALLVADSSQGGTAKLASWGLSVTGPAAASGTFRPGADAWISDTGSGATVGAKLDTSDANGTSASGVLTSGALVLDIAGTTTFSNGVTGSGGLYKAGAGKLVLEGTIDYTGITTVSAGTLDINGTSGGAVTVNNTNSRLSGNGTVGGNATINSGAILAPGNSVGTQNFTKDLAFSSGSIFEWEIDRTKTQSQGTGYDAVTVNGALSGAGAIFRVVIGDSAFNQAFWSQDHSWDNIFNFAGTSTNLATIFNGGFEYSASPAGQGAFSWETNTLRWTSNPGGTFATVPEPTSSLAGLLLAAGLLRRRR